MSPSALGERLAGFHVHIGSQIADVRVYDEVFAQLEGLLAHVFRR